MHVHVFTYYNVNRYLNYRFCYHTLFVCLNENYKTLKIRPLSTEYIDSKNVKEIDGDKIFLIETENLGGSRSALYSIQLSRKSVDAQFVHFNGVDRVICQQHSTRKWNCDHKKALAKALSYFCLFIECTTLFDFFVFFCSDN